MENQSRVFEEFYQVETRHTQARRGLGLGLAIVRRLARLLAYPLRLNSRLGHGTVFSLDVPLLPNGPPDICEPGLDSSGALRGCAVVVDDDQEILNALGDLLRQWGLDVRPFSKLQQVVQGAQLVGTHRLVEDGKTAIAQCLERCRARIAGDQHHRNVRAPARVHFARDQQPGFAALQLIIGQHETRDAATKAA